MRWAERGYQRGDVVRLREMWGVIVSPELPPVADWWYEGKWETRRWYESEISAPYADDYAGIPDEVWGRAAYRRLVA